MKQWLYAAGAVLTLSLVSNVVLCTRCFKAKPVIARVDAGYLMQQMVKTIAARNLSEPETKKATRIRLAQLDRLLEQLAVQENLVIVPDKAVIAGGIDITGEVEAIMEKQDEKAG